MFADGQLEFPDKIKEITYLDYKTGEYSEDTLKYELLFNIKLNVDSEQTRHSLEGDIIVEITRGTDEMYLLDEDYFYEDARLISGSLKETAIYDLCVQCKERVGKYQDYKGNPICASCMQTDECGDICTCCGRKVPYEYMTGDICMECIDGEEFN